MEYFDLCELIKYPVSVQYKTLRDSALRDSV